MELRFERCATIFEQLSTSYLRDAEFTQNLFHLSGIRGSFFQYFQNLGIFITTCFGIWRYKLALRSISPPIDRRYLGRIRCMEKQELFLKFSQWILWINWYGIHGEDSRTKWTDWWFAGGGYGLLELWNNRRIP